MKSNINREDGLKLLRKYNPESFHILHGLTVAGVMQWFANEYGYQGEAEYWYMVGLLHDIDFGMFPGEHCKKSPEILREAGASEEMIYSICSHGHGIVVDMPPIHQMEKILFAVDELTGIIGAAALMRPSKSVKDMEVSSLKKKFKDKKFAGGCSREIIAQGAENLGWSLDELFEKTILAMRFCEDEVRATMNQLESI